MPRVLLLFPPPSDPAQPYASLPTLAAYLRLHGVDVRMADLNIEGVHHLLSGDRLGAAARSVQSWIRDVESRASLDAGSADRYLRAVHAAEFAADTVARTDHALKALRQPETYASLGTFSMHAGVVDAAYRVVSAASYPAVATRHRLDPGSDIWDPQALHRLTADADATPFHRWLRERVRELTAAVQPDLVGISLTFPDQLPLAFLSLAAVREIDPTIVTCLGGATASRLAMRFERLGSLLSLLDVLVVGEGEAALLELSRRAESGAALAGVPNAVCMTPAGPVWGPQGATVSMETLPVPLYSDMNLRDYLAPEPVLLVSGSRACYWGRCKFCDVSGTATEAYRQRSLDGVVDDFLELHDATGARHFMFGDLAIAPERLARFGDRLRAEGLEARWLCQARLEPGFTPDRIRRMADGGCRILVFGLESANQRMLDRMDKGTRMAETEGILNSCADNGVAINLQTFIGFPGETEAEARETVRFVVSQCHAVTSVALTSFKLIEGTSAFHEASSLGLDGLGQTDGTLDVLWDYEVDSGLTPAAADALVRELYVQLVQAFPAAGKGVSWNAHALLLASTGGPDALRLTGDTRPSMGRLRLRRGVVVRRLPFHVGVIARASRGLVTPEFDRQPTWTLLDPDQPRAVPLTDAAAAALLSQSYPAGVPAPARSIADRVRLSGELIKLLDIGLLEGDGHSARDAAVAAEPEALA